MMYGSLVGGFLHDTSLGGVNSRARLQVLGRILQVVVDGLHSGFGIIPGHVNYSQVLGEGGIRGRLGCGGVLKP